MDKKILFLISAVILLWQMSSAQAFIKPNFGLKSHETLVINKIESSESSIKFFLSVENRKQGGTFCADRNIYIQYSDGTRSKLVSSNGIPVCPASYKFRQIGEKLYFALTFPQLRKGTGWIDLIEDCSENCFYFYGISLDNDLNSKIDNAFALAENKQPARALESFIELAGSVNSRNNGIAGLLYVNIIKLAKESGNSAMAAEWYNKLKSSGTPRVSDYIRFLDNQGIKY